MVRLLLCISILMLIFLFGYGNYNFITFIFILGSIILPPVIFNYNKYPERSIYLFLILWITFPKYIRYLPIIGTYDLPGVNYFDIFQAVFTFHIAFLLVKKGFKNIINLQLPKSINRITLFFIFTILIGTVSGAIRYFLFVPRAYHIEVGNLIEYAFTPFSGIIFFLGLFAFINKYKQVEKLIYIFALAGILILLEHLLMVRLNLFNELNIYAYAADQTRFNSLIYGSYDIKGIFCVLSSISFLYLAFEKRKYYFLILVFLIIIPIFTTYQRTSYIGYFLGLITFFLIYFKEAKQFSKILISTALVLITIYISFNQKSLSQSVNNFITGNEMVRQQNIADNQSLYDRMGLWYRAADVFIYSFPFGVGEGMYEVYANRRFASAYVAPFVNLRSMNSYRAISSEKVTKPHNVYIQFISEYNILGLLVLYFFIRQLLRYIRNKKFTKSNNKNNIYRATVISMIFALGVMSLFDSVIRLYFLYGMLMFMAFFISKSKTNSDISNVRNY